jgi:hypothetical protein
MHFEICSLISLGDHVPNITAEQGICLCVKLCPQYRKAKRHVLVNRHGYGWNARLRPLYAEPANMALPRPHLFSFK